MISFSRDLLTSINFDAESPIEIAIVFSSVQVIKKLIEFCPNLLIGALDTAVSSSSLLQLFVRGNQMILLQEALIIHWAVLFLNLVRYLDQNKDAITRGFDNDTNCHY